MSFSFRQWLIAALSLLASLLAPQVWAKECLPPFALPTEAELAAAARQAQDRGFLWKITKNQKTSFLYGTTHLSRLEWWAPGPGVSAALGSSRVLALELDLSDVDTATQLTHGMRAKRGDPQLPPDLQTRLRREAEAECIDWASVQSLRPEFQMSSVVVAAARRQRLEAAFGTETMLTAMALRQGIPLHGLETVEEQIKALSAANAAELKDSITGTLDDMESGLGQKVLIKLANAWANRDAMVMQTYEQWCDCMTSEAERALSRRLLDDRNHVLAARIDALHGADGRVFAAVGALHMFGSNALPELMKARGYTVEPSRSCGM